MYGLIKNVMSFLVVFCLYTYLRHDICYLLACKLVDERV